MFGLLDIPDVSFILVSNHNPTWIHSRTSPGRALVGCCTTARVTQLLSSFTHAPPPAAHSLCAARLVAPPFRPTSSASVRASSTIAADRRVCTGPVDTSAQAQVNFDHGLVHTGLSKFSTCPYQFKSILTPAFGDHHAAPWPRGPAHDASTASTAHAFSARGVLPGVPMPPAPPGAFPGATMRPGCPRKSQPGQPRNMAADVQRGSHFVRLATKRASHHVTYDANTNHSTVQYCKLSG